jgi:hypothetical protein
MEKISFLFDAFKVLKVIILERVNEIIWILILLLREAIHAKRYILILSTHHILRDCSLE